MSELAGEYFRRDLSPEEEAELAARLRESPQAAERFWEAAEADYRRLRLPRLSGNLASLGRHLIFTAKSWWPNFGR